MYLIFKIRFEDDKPLYLIGVRLFVPFLFYFFLIHICFADEWYEIVRRSILRGAGRPFPAGELYNLRRSEFFLPNLPDPLLNSTLVPSSAELQSIQTHYQYHTSLKNTLHLAIYTQRQRSSDQIQDLTLTALLLVTKGLIEEDTLSLQEAKQILLSLPPAPTKGSWARSDLDSKWGDILESSYSLISIAICYDILRSSLNPSEREKILTQIFTLFSRIQSGIEVIGPNNHALITGSHLASAVLLLNESDWHQRNIPRTQLWKIAERLMQIGLAQVSRDGIYREGPGYAQEVLRSLTRFALILKLRTHQNLFSMPLLKKLAISTAHLSDDFGNPLPFDDTYPFGKNLWQSLSLLITNQPLIHSFGQQAPHPYANLEGLFFLVRFPAYRSSNAELNSVQELYLEGGYLVWREPNQWVVAASGEPRSQWTGRHEQLDIGNLCIAVKDNLCITSGGYGKRGVLDESRRYYLSGEAHSSFLVNGQPMVEWVETPENENDAHWTGTKWNNTGFYGKVRWIQDGATIQRNFLRAGKRLIVIDETNTTKMVENQFLCNGELRQISLGDWEILVNDHPMLSIQTLPATNGNISKGIISPLSNETKFVERIRFPVSQKRITLFSPVDEPFAVRTYEYDKEQRTIEKLEWYEKDGTHWCIRISNHQLSVSSSNFRGEQFQFLSTTSLDRSSTIFWQDSRGFAIYPSPTRYNELSDSSQIYHLISHLGISTLSDSLKLNFKIISQWFVYGNPDIQIYRFDTPSKPHALSRLSTSASGTEFSDWYRSLTRESQTQMESACADSILLYSKQALDTLQLHQFAKTVVALIDGTTDGFAPRVFRVPFDFRETFSFHDSENVTLNLRGTWGSGFRMEKVFFRYEQMNHTGWEFSRDTPHQNLEQYTCGIWRNHWSVYADHSDSYLSGISTRYSNKAMNLFFRGELKQKHFLQYSSFGYWGQHQYSVLHTKKENAFGYSTQKQMKNFNFSSGFLYAQNLLNRTERKSVSLSLNYGNFYTSSLQYQHYERPIYLSKFYLKSPKYTFNTFFEHSQINTLRQEGTFLVRPIIGNRGFFSFASEYSESMSIKIHYARYPLKLTDQNQILIGFKQLTHKYGTLESSFKHPFGLSIVDLGLSNLQAIWKYGFISHHRFQSFQFTISKNEQSHQFLSTFWFQFPETSKEISLELQWNRFSNDLPSITNEAIWDFRLEMKDVYFSDSIHQSISYRKNRDGDVIAEGGFSFQW